MKSESTFQRPDFDFPQTVVRDARPFLNSKMPAERFRAVLEIVRAKEEVSTDSLFAMPTFVGSRAAVEPCADYRGLMKLYQARLLRFIFNQYRRKFSSANTPLHPLPEDIALWNAQQFDSVCDSLVAEALELLEPYGRKPIKDYSEVIVVPDKWKDFYPTLRDFALIQAYMSCPSQKEEYARQGEAASPRGTAPWAYWAWICFDVKNEDGSVGIEGDFQKTNVRGYINLYKICPQGLAGGFFLWKACSDLGWDPGYEQRSELIALLRTYLGKNVENQFTNILRYYLHDFITPQLNIIVPELAYPGSEISVQCSCEFMDTVGVEIVEEKDFDLNKGDVKVIARYAVPVTVESSTFDLKVRMPSVEGKYALRPYAKTKDLPSGRYKLYAQPAKYVTVTSCIPMLMTTKNSYLAAVVDFYTGSPVKGKNVVFRESGIEYRDQITDENGYVKGSIPLPRSYWESYKLGLVTKVGKVVEFNSLCFYPGNYNPMKSKLNGSVYVNRPVYHQGESVEWAVVVSKLERGKSYELAKDQECKVIMRDANGEIVDSIVCRLDKYGRASGSFNIPADRLTGSYSIIAMCGLLEAARNSFMVSDFKLNVFKVEDLVAIQNGDTIVVSGKAIRYTGAPMAGANVKVELNQCPGYARTGNQNKSYGQFEGTVNSKGIFAISIPLAAVPANTYNVKVNVVALTGESIDEAFNVRFGKAYQLSYSGSGEQNFNLDNPINLDVKANNIMELPDSLAVKWYLIADGKSNLEGTGTVTPSGFTVDLNSEKVGKYILKIVATDSQLCDNEVEVALSLYSINSNSVVEGTILLLPDKVVEVPENSPLTFKVGCDRDGYVYIFAPKENGEIVAVNQAIKTGFTDVSIDGFLNRNCMVHVARVCDGVTAYETLAVKRVKTEIVRIEGESWRDKVIPGAPEQWTLKFSRNNIGMTGAMIATMYNSSLEALAQLSWPSKLDNLLFPKAAVPQIGASFVGDGVLLGRLRMREEMASGYNISFYAPWFRYMEGDGSGGGFGAFSGYLGEDMTVFTVAYGRAYKSSSANRSAVTNDAVFDAEAEVEESAAVTESAMAAGVDNGAEADGTQSSDFEFRDGEVLQALWMPSITIDDHGEASLHFVMPDAVGQWSFRAVAWNDECASPLLEKTLVASRPVMVQATVPRFMRRGDEVVAAVTVINNYADSLTISVTTEVFDPATGGVLTTWTDAVNVAAGGQTILSKELTASVDISTIGFRAKATAQNFTDGEQWAIPVLESATTAIDSEVFFLSEAHPTFTTELRANTSDSDIVAIQYCQNPIWEAVKTLPGMYDATPATALSAANSAYAAAVARSLYDRFPEIKNALDIWQTENGGDALESKLVKDEDLKLLTLARTPFVGAANANTEQMERLALTFDKKIIDKTFDTAIATLASLQKSDGGFGWGSWSEHGSFWVTEHVLECFGRLNSLGCEYKNDKLDKIFDRAFAFIDSTVGDGTFNLEYTLVYSLFRDRKVSTLNGQKTISATMNKIFLHWDGASVADKSVYAIVLQGFGRTSVAREIMRSIEEFAVETPREGVMIPSVNYFNTYAQVLEAFGRINPSAKIAGGLRQWIVFNSPTVQDLGTWSPATLVAAILMTAPGLPAAQTRFDITIGEQEIVPEKYESYTGAFSMRLEPSNLKRKFEVKLPQGCDMAYGALVNVGKVPLAEVKPTSNEHVSVEKRFLVRRDGEWVETTEFRLGENVKVQLTVTTDRPLEYVTIVDERPAAFEPVDQMPGWARAAAGVSAYRESGDDATRFYIGWLPKGSYFVEYDATATYGGSFASGTATLQSQRAPEFSGRSGASIIEVK